MFKGWRSRLHYWSRRGDVLKKASVIIVLGAFLLASIIIQLTPQRSIALTPDPVEQAVRRDWSRLHHAASPQPRELARTLRQTVAYREHLCEVLGLGSATWEDFEKHGMVAGFDMRGVIAKHAPEGDLARLFTDYLAAALAADQPAGKEAAQRLRERAQQEPQPPFAGELHAAVLLLARDEEGALAALMREAALFADAVQAREDSLRLALRLKDKASVRLIAEAPGWLAGMPPLLQHHAGVQLHDPWMQWGGLLRHRLEHVPFAALALAFFVTALWYIIFVLHAPARPWRWAWPIAPLVAGVISVWPVLIIGAWQEAGLGMSEHAPFPQDLWFYLAGVGLREEAAKLALVALFMPWLLWLRAPAMALMTGAFIGLGFALEENISYYQEFGGGVALVRFLSANFLHAALTGMAAHALYDMLRSRFARAERFIVTFFGVVAAHGAYDYAATSDIGGLDYFSMILLAFIAWQFLDIVDQEAPHAPQTVSPAAVFLLGAAVLIAIIFLTTAVQSPQMDALAAAGQECLTILPVAVIYWRRFETRSGVFHR